MRVFEDQLYRRIGRQRHKHRAQRSEQPVQMAPDRQDIGAATGCLLFLRSMGGAFGSTMVGALLASGFTARLASPARSALAATAS